MPTQLERVARQTKKSTFYSNQAGGEGGKRRSEETNDTCHRQRSKDLEVDGSRIESSRVAVEGPRVTARRFIFVWSAGLSRGLRLVKIVKMKDEGGACES
ncbi:hypothetical protein CRG98_042035 [Punica granatum]|uniref:Uncharacterized protein n=1 Tax=Punica granatum TaxID=22663 RepID=A0A2I0I0R4_PUNGR|nr:hypothetical protein CRG98_042035 [Punica granatum]